MRAREPREPEKTIARVPVQRAWHPWSDKGRHGTELARAYDYKRYKGMLELGLIVRGVDERREMYQ